MTRFRTAEWRTTANTGSLALAVTDWTLFLADPESGAFSVVLSGGATPQRLITILGRSPRLDRFPWAHVRWFWDDERFEIYTDVSFKYRMADEAMLSGAPTPPNNINAATTQGLWSNQAAARYEARLQFYRSERLDRARPLFDLYYLILLLMTTRLSRSPTISPWMSGVACRWPGQDLYPVGRSAPLLAGTDQRAHSLSLPTQRQWEALVRNGWIAVER